MEPSANRHLSLTKIFPGIRPETAQALAQATADMRRGPRLWVDVSPERVIIVLEGGAEFMRGTPERMFVAETLRPGDVLQVSKGSGDGTSACRSVGFSALLEVRAERFAEVRRADLAFDAALSARLAARHEDALRRLSRHVIHPVRERVLDELRRLAVPGRDGRPTAAVTQFRLAELAGTCRESASRAVAGLVRDGVLGRLGQGRYVFPG